MADTGEDHDGHVVVVGFVEILGVELGASSGGLDDVVFAEEGEHWAGDPGQVIAGVNQQRLLCYCLHELDLFRRDATQPREVDLFEVERLGPGFVLDRCPGSRFLG